MYTIENLFHFPSVLLEWSFQCIYNNNGYLYKIKIQYRILKALMSFEIVHLVRAERNTLLLWGSYQSNKHIYKTNPHGFSTRVDVRKINWWMKMYRFWPVDTPLCMTATPFRDQSRYRVPRPSPALVWWMFVGRGFVGVGYLVDGIKRTVSRLKTGPRRSSGGHLESIWQRCVLSWWQKRLFALLVSHHHGLDRKYGPPLVDWSRFDDSEQKEKRGRNK